MEFYKYFYIISGFLWGIETIPQILRTYKRKTVNDISLYYPLICFIAFIFFLTGTYIEKNWIMFFPHIFPFILMGIFLTQIFIYRGKK